MTAGIKGMIPLVAEFPVMMHGIAEYIPALNHQS